MLLVVEPITVVPCTIQVKVDSFSGSSVTDPRALVDVAVRMD